MTAKSSTHSFGSAQEYIPTCEKHELTTDMTCEDCDEFICSKCAKTDHKDHDWKTIITAGTQRREDLNKTLSKVREKDVKEIKKKMQKAAKLMEDNQKCCDSELSKLQTHYDEIVAKLDKNKEKIETKLKENLKSKNAEMDMKKSELESKAKNVLDLVNLLEGKHSTLSDYSLISNLRDLNNLLPNKDSDKENGDHSVRYRRGVISEELVDSMMGQTLDLDDFSVTEAESFQYGDKNIRVLRAINEDSCIIGASQLDNIEQVNKRDKKREKLNVYNVNDVYVTGNGDLYATDNSTNYIVQHSSSGSVVSLFCNALSPIGICQSIDKGLLITFIDVASDLESVISRPNSSTRCLVSHMKPTGHVIREYEYHENGLTRLFTIPYRVKQNGNTDICVVNMTSESTGELVILSVSGSLKNRYIGQKLVKKFHPTDVACDSRFNIIVNNFFNSNIHLQSFEGEFMKYLLTRNDVADPYSMSLCKSTLWVGNYHGFVKVFNYNIT